MLDSIRAAEKASDIIAHCATSDIWTILDQLGILYGFPDLGSAKHGLKGYCTGFFGQFYIAVNRNLPQYLQVLIAWHELGHIVLDPELLENGGCVYDYDPFHTYSQSENRANYFAAEGRIQDNELMELLQQGYTLRAAAAELRVPSDFISYKVQILREYGVPLHLTDTPDSSCLSNDLMGEENF